MAGAGTGKTQVVTRRIAWLIATKRARPEEILGLTFTDKAAAEMEARVDVLVPYGFVGATLSTFHAFCDRLVREHAVELGLTSQLRVETPAEILVFLRERLFDLGLERLPAAGQPRRAPEGPGRLLRPRARRGRDARTEYAAFAAQLAADAGDDPALRDRAEAELEKARAYGAYQKLLLESGRVDFGSQISLALRLLRERAYLRRELQERYRYVLVDEFQDTNHVQFELVKTAGRRVAATSPWWATTTRASIASAAPRSRTCSASSRSSPARACCCCAQNYRSGQRILDLAHRLIQANNPARLEARLGYDKRLLAWRGIDAPVEHRAFACASDEAETVAAEIAAAIAAGGTAGAGLRRAGARALQPRRVRARAASPSACASVASGCADSTRGPRCTCASTSCARWPTPTTARPPTWRWAIPCSGPTRWTWRASGPRPGAATAGSSPSPREAARRRGRSGRIHPRGRPPFLRPAPPARRQRAAPARPRRCSTSS